MYVVRVQYVYSTVYRTCISTLCITFVFGHRHFNKVYTEELVSMCKSFLGRLGNGGDAGVRAGDADTSTSSPTPASLSQSPSASSAAQALGSGSTAVLSARKQYAQLLDALHSQYKSLKLYERGVDALRALEASSSSSPTQAQAAQSKEAGSAGDALAEEAARHLQRTLALDLLRQLLATLFSDHELGSAAVDELLALERDKFTASVRSLLFDRIAIHITAATMT